MLKTAMLVSALAISAPALAQDAMSPAFDPQAAQTTPTDTVTPPAAETAPAAPMTAQTTDPAAAPAQAPTDQTTAQAPAAPPAGQQPATGAAQIAQVVETEFPSYDKNADGNLDKTEFSSWLVALKTASDPSTKASDPATQTWVTGAFASADTDKSSVVSKAELTTYLSQGASS